jgi:hypothetical protein
MSRTPGRPRITTHGSEVTFSGNAFVFARSRRDVIDLHDLRDTIVGYQTRLDAENSTIAAVSTSVAAASTSVAAALATAEASMSARLATLEAADHGCIPYVEFVNNGNCMLLSPVCRASEWEAVRPTRTSDRVCRAPTPCSAAQYQTAPSDAHHDRACATATVCNSTAFELTPPTATSDRVCVAGFASCSTYRPRTNGVVRLIASNGWTDTYCRDDGRDFGGDGSTRALAGKSCYTIRHAFGVTEDATYWVFENSASSPFQVFCDMTQCGGDSRGMWANANRSLCGGWTLVMKDVSGGIGLNRRQNSRWRSTSTIGSTTTRSEGLGKGPGFARSSFTDIMIASLRAGQYARNVGWRHAQSRPSMYSVTQSCNRQVTDGKLLVPNYISPSTEQFRYAIQEMDWRSGRGGRDSGYSYHEVCHRSRGDPGHNGIYKFGFYQRDSTCCPGIIGCRNQGGHGGNVVGFGGACGNNQDGDCPRSYGSHDGLYTRCTVAWGFGSGYHAMSSRTNQETVTGHWWGAGDRAMQLYQTGLYVRDHTDVV